MRERIKAPVPLLRGKQSTYQGGTVFTADSTEPVAWACGTCGQAAMARKTAERCCDTHLYDRCASPGTPGACTCKVFAPDLA